jgi:hypothetical protein
LKARAALGIATVLTITAAVPTFGYLKLGSSTGTRTVNLRWLDFPIRYFVTNRGEPQVTAQQFQAAITRAFGTWAAVDTADLESEFVGFTQANPVRGDGVTVLGFNNRPDLDRVLAATNFTFDVTNGEIVESDIFFNSAFLWSVDPAGVTGRHDLESIAVHEIGHLLGLSHSAVGETEMIAGGRRVLGAQSVMFPIAFAAGSIHDRSLKADDIAGITDIYPTTEARQSRGSISGKVTKNGAGVLGAHIVAFNPATGALVGGFSLSEDGSFTIAGLEAGPHVLRVEPLDDGDIDSFFDSSVDVDLDFRVRFHDKVIAVPLGGGTRNHEIKVTPK